MDNDPKHTAKATQEFIKTMKWNILEWPPDLIPKADSLLFTSVIYITEILWLQLAVVTEHRSFVLETVAVSILQACKRPMASHSQNHSPDKVLKQGYTQEYVPFESYTPQTLLYRKVFDQTLRIKS